jgi:hypothetical protein
MKILINALLASSALVAGIDQKIIRVDLEKKLTNYDKSIPVNEVFTLASEED